MKVVSLTPYFGWDIYYEKKLRFDGHLYAVKRKERIEVTHKHLHEAIDLLHAKIFDYEFARMK